MSKHASSNAPLHSMPDFSNFLRAEEGELVLMDDFGPGCVYRVFMPVVRSLAQCVTSALASPCHMHPSSTPCILIQSHTRERARERARERNTARAGARAHTHTHSLAVSLSLPGVQISQDRAGVCEFVPMAS